ncbi:MAG TPA: hypothetical protein VNM92_10255 [Thermoanaerobaculia bacterium]|nr:hypothetical protein [Thermoanaerobaculia bacterium]
MTNCKLTLNGPAADGGMSIPLFSTGPGSVPSSVNVSAGQLESEPFSVATTQVTSRSQLSIFAGSANVGGFTVIPVAVANLLLSTQTVPGGTIVTASIILNGDAPPGGFSVPLSSGNISAATVPPTILVPAGQTTGSFPITTSVVQNDTTVTITAGAIGATRTAPLVVRAGS